VVAAYGGGQGGSGKGFGTLGDLLAARRKK